MSICHSERIIYNKAFNKLMKVTEKAVTTIRDRKARNKLTYQLLKQLQEMFPNKRWGTAKKLLKVLRKIINMLSDRGFSFVGRDELMKQCGCKDSTIDVAMTIIKESGLFEVKYRENPKSNGYKTPVVILKSHPNYDSIMEILELETYKQEVKQEVENAQTSTGTMDTEGKEGSTYLSPKDTYTKNNKDNNKEEIKALNNFFQYGLSEDQIKAKEIMSRNKLLHETIQLKARPIVKEFPSQFSKLDWSVFADLMLSLHKRQPNKPVGYVVSAFYKNKLVQAEQLGLSLDDEYMREDMLPKKYKIMKLIKPYMEKMEAYKQAGNIEMADLIQKQIDRYMEQMGKSNCYVPN